MGTFAASLRAVGDVRALPAIVELSEGRLRIAAGSTEIGSWSLTEIHLEEVTNGYRMAAEGDQILIELTDVDSFTAELNKRTKRRLSRGRRQGAAAQTPVPKPSAPPITPAAENRTRVERTGSSVSISLPPREETKARPAGLAARSVDFADRILAVANKRLGPYLPEWIFTRIMFAVAFIALILLIVVPGLVSAFFLIAGGVIIILGAVTYTDTVVASRWLPGRTQPPHVLLFGVAILMMGVLLGVIAG